MVLFNAAILALFFLFSTARALSVGNRAFSSSISRGSIPVDADGTRIAYTDSGVPSKLSSDYITIFEVNGLGYDSAIFSVLQKHSSTSAFRVVAVDRRGYGNSSIFTQAEQKIIRNGTENERDQLSKELGVQLLTFVDDFMQQNHISPVSPDRKTGGAAIVGWSFGSILTLSAIAHVDSIPDDMRERLSARLRTLVMQEPSTDTLGMLPAPKTWLPVTDDTIPPDFQRPMLAQWVSSYFAHGDLSTRDPNVLQYVLPAFDRMPTIWNMTAQIDVSLQTGLAAMLDVDILTMWSRQLEASYIGANFNRTIRSLLPNMRNWLINGDRTTAFAVYASWVVQDNNTAAGGGFIDFKLIPGVNHFVHWDEPEMILDIYHEIIAV